MHKYFIVSLLLQVYIHVNGKVVREFFMERTEMVYKNVSIGDAYINLKKFNRTLYVMNMNLTLIKPLPNDVYMLGAVYKFDNGVYKLTAYQVQKKLCDILSEEYRLIWGQELRTGTLQHFIKQCPIMPGFYYFDNAPVPAQWPYTPPWRCMLQVKVFTKTARILEVHTYVGYKEHII